MQQIHHTLDGIGVFAGLSSAVRQELEAKCAWKTYAPDDTILDPEIRDTDIYFIVRGSVRVINYGANGKEISFAEMKAGDCFGELSAIDGRPRSASILALEPTAVATLKAEALHQIMLAQPEVTLALLRKVTAMLREASSRIMQLSTVNANTRVYAEVLRLAQALAMDKRLLPGKPLVLRPAPVHSDIAARVSTTRETVARAFGVLTRQGIIKRVRGGIEVLNLPALAAMATEEG
jgi:CRP-like cAMP-binding protein